MKFKPRFVEPPERWQLINDFEISPKWMVGHKSSNYEGAIVEYILVGENINNWSQLVTTQFFAGTFDVQRLNEIVSITKAGLEEGCGLLEWNVIQNHPGDIIFEWNHSGCNGFPATYEVARLKIGEEGLYRLAYDIKTKSIIPSLKTHWVEFVEKPRLVRVR